MRLILNNNTKDACTLKHKMEDEQQDLWLQATKSVEKLTEVQKLVVKLLPDCRKQLPSSFKDLEDANAQSALKSHIRLRSLYALSEKIWEKIEEGCKALAKCSGDNVPEERDAQESLQAILMAVEEFPFDYIINDNVNGLHRINELKDKFGKGLGFMVYDKWNFLDIIGLINNQGIKYEEFWKSVADSQDPEDSNLKMLLDDDTMLRID